MESSIGERLTKLISGLKITPNAFAGRLGVKTSIIYNILKEKNKPSFDLIYKISDETGVSTDWLIKGLGDNDENYLKSVIENYAKKDTLKDNLVDNKTVGTVGDTGQKQLRRVEIEAIALKQLTTIRDIRERDEEMMLKPIPGMDQPHLAKGENLRKLRISYDKRIRMDLKLTDENMNELLMLIEDTETIIDLVSEMNLYYINNKPDPFETTQYYDIEKHTINIPDTIDYKDYKKNIVEWLKESEKYKSSLSTFYNAADTFLKEVTGRDDYNF